MKQEDTVSFFYSALSTWYMVSACLGVSPFRIFFNFKCVSTANRFIEQEVKMRTGVYRSKSSKFLAEIINNFNHNYCDYYLRQKNLYSFKMISFIDVKMDTNQS